MKTLKLLVSAFVLVHFIGVCNAQMANTYPPSPVTRNDSIFTEIDLGHSVCTAQKDAGFPRYFVVRSVRLEILLKDIDSVKKCLLKVNRYITSPRQYMDKVFLVSPMISPHLPTMLGEDGDTHCAVWKNETNTGGLVQFIFAYLTTKEINELSRKTLDACLEKMKKIRLPDESRPFPRDIM